MKKDFLTLFSLEKEELEQIIKRTFELKDLTKKNIPTETLKGKTLVMIFEKASTRTRLSFEIGMYQLGGNAVFLSKNDSQLGRSESIEDTGRVISGYADLIMIRTFKQSNVEKLAEYSGIPVINGLTDEYHPVQILSDLFTISEKGYKIEKVKMLYVGDGNNVAHSLINGSAIFGYKLFVATPEGYEPDENILKRAREKGGDISVIRDPYEAIGDIDVFYTDVWVSMGQENEEAERVKIFKKYQINEELLSKNKNDFMVLHCLPAHKGLEITEEVFERYADDIFMQAENRMHAQKALMEYIVNGK